MRTMKVVGQLDPLPEILSDGGCQYNRPLTSCSIVPTTSSRGRKASGEPAYLNLTRTFCPIFISVLQSVEEESEMVCKD
jgi:hypothetical protein